MCYSKALFAHHRTLNTSIEQFYGGYGSYWTYRSFFWNVVWKLTCDYHSIDRAVRDWSEQTVWSNLYKISTEEGNPDEYLKGVQLKGATELVKKEIEELKPKYCIVLTNISWWQPFGDKLATSQIRFDKAMFPDIESLQGYKGADFSTKIIVTTRPFVGNSDSHVSQILRLIQYCQND